ncbi:MAG: hypothetical protein ABEH86_11105 [Haloarcula sp.]
MDEPSNQAAVTPSLDRAERIERREPAAYEYAMLGVTFSGEVQATTYDPPERIVYEIPGPLPESLGAPFVRWYNCREINALLDNGVEAVEAERAIVDMP